MKAFTTVIGIAAHLPMANVDTDMIIPKQYLKTIKRTGLGKCLFAELRYDEAGNPIPSFVLNQPPYDHAQILLAGENFGCGSSREHAPWSLLDFSIRVIIAPSFADIFYNNSFKNGLLLITLPAETIQILANAHHNLQVDLEAQKITVGDRVIPFVTEPYRRTALLEGLDDIGETLHYQDQIAAFETKQKAQQPWLYS